MLPGDAPTRSYNPRASGSCAALADPRSAMSAHLAQLRLAGFKSFADPATLDILPGLTGLVGPNGCGKSNLAEALRWAMGEGQAGALRGGAMDDLIFAGTRTRPIRDAAEVALTLEGSFPPPFTGETRLQVTRRIGRGGGSTYQVNGRDVRARDVRALFADLGGGARASAMVGQNGVAAVIAARPDERRGLLEDAAGLAGLHARRAEADAKLRAAETNLARAGDRHALLEGQLAGLQRQTQQAARHADLLTRIAAAEAGLHALARSRAAATRAAADAAWAAAQSAAPHAASYAHAAETASETAAAALPGLRSAEASARTAAERARLRQEGHTAAAAQAREALRAAAARHGQVARDLANAEAACTDAVRTEAELAEEAASLAAAEADAPSVLASLQAEVAAAAGSLAAEEASTVAAAARVAAHAVEARALGQALGQAEARVRRAAEGQDRAEAARGRAATGAPDRASLAAALAAAEAAAGDLGSADERLRTAAYALDEAAASATAAREAAISAAVIHDRLTAEAGALAEVLTDGQDGGWVAVLDQLVLPPGLEAALGVALGEELQAAGDPGGNEAPRHWRVLPKLAPPSLPGTPLSSLVGAPPALARALSGIGVVAGDAEGDAAQPELTPGQSLVSREGALWRWDGYTVRAGTPTAAAARLLRRNRLATVRAQATEAEQVAVQARAASQAADAAERACAAAEVQARTARRSAEARAGAARGTAQALQTASDATAALLAGLDAQLAALAPDAADAETALEEARSAQAALPAAGRLDAEAAQARNALAAARARDAAATRALDGAIRDGAARRARMAALAREREAWAARAAQARVAVAGLRTRLTEADAEHARLSAAQADLDAAGRDGTAGVPEAEAAHRAAALAVAEHGAATAARAAQAAAAALAAAREDLVRAEAAAVQADHAWQALPPPSDAPGVAAADLSPAAEARARASLARLLRERDALGPVNLRAVDEAAALATEVGTAARGRDEVAAAAASLRGSLRRLDEEARSRLLSVFDEVDRHFQDLFRRVFLGGQARLGLVDSDDPLQAGLEVQAQPPGKRLASLSLLSGGEQSLTALCLVLAVFRCNPAPVCVLDEVDAALDDANVDRLCALLADLAQDGARLGAEAGGTRFLVVTHHGLTMARMDRLYGVTMQEPGVSRLLSVDLGEIAAWSGERAA